MKYFLCHTDFDGFLCYVFYKRFLVQLGYKCIPINYGDLDPKNRLTTKLLKDGSEFYFADITPPLSFLEQVRDRNVFIVDHHKQALLDILEAEKDLSPNLHIYGDVQIWDSNCGGSLLFRFSPFLNICEEDRLKYKWFYDRVEVYDLWKDNDELWDEAVALQRCWVRIPEYSSPNKSFTSGQYDGWIKELEGKTGLSRWEKITKQTFESDFKKSLTEKMSNLKIKIDKEGNKYGVFTASSMNSLLCSSILKNKPDIKYVLCINGYHKAFGKVSARTREDRDFSVNGLVVEGIEFRGHKLAAGADFGNKIHILLK